MPELTPALPLQAGRRDLSAAIVKRPHCPACGGTNVRLTLSAKVSFDLEGWNERGDAIAKVDEPDAIYYDTREFLCTDCGHSDGRDATFQAVPPPQTSMSQGR